MNGRERELFRLQEQLSELIEIRDIPNGNMKFSEYIKLSNKIRIIETTIKNLEDCLPILIHNEKPTVVN